MANTLTGRVIEVRPTQTMVTKNGTNFAKREIILDCTRYDPYTGERGFENTPCIAFTQTNCGLLDSIIPGMVVTISIDITGKKAPDKDTYYNDIRGYRVDIVRQADGTSAPAQPAAQPATQPMAQPAQAYPQQYAAPVSAPQAPAAPVYAQQQYPQYAQAVPQQNYPQNYQQPPQQSGAEPLPF